MLHQILWYAGLTIGVIALLVILFLWYIGYFNEVHVRKGESPGGHCLYYDYQGNYKGVGDVFNKAEKEMADFLNTLPDTDLMGIYYDDPSGTQNPADTRAILGCLIPRHVQKAEVDRLNQGRFKYRYIPPCPAAVCHFKHRNLIGYIIMHMKVIPYLDRFMSKHNLREHYACPGLEIYRWRAPTLRNEIYITYGETSKDYEFSVYPKPAMKHNAKYQ